MTLDEKVSTLGLNGSPDGYQNYFPAIPRLCVPRLILQDGPAGVAQDFTGVTQLPAPISVAASWDRSVATDYGTVLGTEAWGKGIHVAQGPMLNIARVPQGGRDFESYGEDPYLTGRLGVANIAGIQGVGVMANAKHYFANNQETNRESINEYIDERTQREIYLPHFEAAVKDGNIASMMCSFNQINGEYSCQNSRILTDILKGEWGFKGFVRSDWGATHSTAAAYNAGMDLAKPSRADLRSAVDQGLIPMSRIDDGVLRVLRVMFEYGLFERQPTGTKDSVVTTPEHAAIARDVSAQGTVLLKNSAGVLPLDNTKIGSIAVLGNNAADDIYSGGDGSSAVVSPYVVSPLQGITDRAGKSVTINHPAGQPNGDGALPPVSSEYLTPPSGEGHGLQASYYNNKNLTGNPVLTRVDPNIDVNWTGSPGTGVPANNFSVRWTGTLTPPKTGTYTFSLLSEDGSRLYIDGKLVIDNWGARNHPDAKWGTVDLEAGRNYAIKVEHFKGTDEGKAHLGWADVAQMRLDAAAAAKESDVAVVVANDRRTEGRDRPNLQLPFEQDKLIEAVAAANPNTIVVLNTGGPMLMPWADKVAGIMEAWYPGQEDGNALAQVLFGDVNPSGKLPMTFPRDESQTPVSSPERWPGVNGQAYYSEGLQVGYRWYDAQGVEPLFPFGHGLSYTSFRVDQLVAAPKQLSSDGRLTVQANVTNTGPRAGAEVVQLYVGMPAGVGEPPKQLKGFQKVSLKPGESRQVTFELTPRDLSYWDTRERGWVLAAGDYTIMVGTSSRDIAVSDTIRVKKAIGPRYLTATGPAIIDPGATATVTTSFTNDSAYAVHDAGLALSHHDGLVVKASSPASFQQVVPGQTVTTTWQVTAPEGATPNEYQLIGTATYQASQGATQSSDSVTVTVPYTSLAAAFNNAGVSDDSDVDGASFDSVGDSYSAQMLAAAGISPGAAVEHKGLTFTWPDVDVGEPNNVVAQGQTVALSGSGARLGILGAASGGKASGIGTVHYSDGTTSSFTLTLGDWWSGPIAGNDAVASTPYVNSQGIGGRERGQRQHAVYVFYAEAPVTAGKQVVAVTLPTGGSSSSGQISGLHLFALAVG
ncbi:glycoside hydrolase family 3 C-terminal domain-containing protein [Micromonospora yasonensis]|uniref:glycoside hydrolase family 3 C-terminal domain-containing protein n=1 Tax=Micromonospora yasonensis TaxID=1128667 RepID=UPI00223120F6|nr:glycoside hydrolase family 3 C-terminal domain-containing protein [Micromonospora yasonensis]MCW3844893.1 glycoside hydrolase family 3 C-terminal domain-containing protein [Micromonospora yasonensis]